MGLVELAEGGLVSLVIHRHALGAEAPRMSQIKTDNICNVKESKNLLANGIQLLYCWEDTVSVLLNVIHAIENILTSNLYARIKY